MTTCPPAPVAPRPPEDRRASLIRRFYEDRVLAHRVIFESRHPQASPDFHTPMILAFHGGRKYEEMMAFRGGAKSTIAEEGLPLLAGFKEIKNAIIIGKNQDRAIERLAAIKHEIVNNERLAQVFGPMQGPIWGDDKIVLANDVMMQAYGRGQALRGIKHHDFRPDFFLLDDLEEREDVRTPEIRAKLLRWLMTSLIPACDPAARGRMLATPLDIDALPMALARDPRWHVQKFPIMYQHESGKPYPLRAGSWVPAWPARFPLTKGEAAAMGPKVQSVEEIEESFIVHGMLQDFNSEYMVEAETPEAKPFKSEMFVIEPQVKTWQAVYAMFDPARTVKDSSATTGYAAWSWIGAKLVIWDAWGKFLMPDKIVEAVFECDREHQPVHIGVEEDGLNEWLLQPIRQEQVRQGRTIPFRAMKAPRGKIDFIRGLQPFFKANEVIFTRDLPELRAQLLSFPTGKIDTPNALAYALKLRPGAPIYEDFGMRHITEDLMPATGQAAWLCLNAIGGLVTGVLCQAFDGKLLVLADWVREGDAGAVVGDIIQAANLEAGRQVRILAPPIHWNAYDTVGLRPALGALVREVRKGTPPELGRDWMRQLIRQERRGMPALVVSSEARWTLNAFVGGYAREILKGGQLSEFADTGQYKVLMEGLEAFAGLLKVGSTEDSDSAINYATTPDGRRYVSSLANHRR